MTRARLQPDPSRPFGGWAHLTIDTPAPVGGAAELVIFNHLREQFLSDKGAWVSNEVSAGRFTAVVGTDGTIITLPPHIVDAMEEYAKLSFTHDSTTYEAVWPDDILPLPEGAGPGGLSTPKTEPVIPEDREVRLFDETDHPNETAEEIQEDTAYDEDEVPVFVDTDVSKVTEISSKKRKWPIVLLILLALIIATIVAYVVMSKDGEPELAIDYCSEDSLPKMLERPLSEMLSVAQECGDLLPADTILRLLEAGVDNDDPLALLSFGKLYDPTVDFAGSLGFTPNLGIAADYYTRAKQVGAAGAETGLATVCETLNTTEGPMAQVAASQYCSTTAEEN